MGGRAQGVEGPPGARGVRGGQQDGPQRPLHERRGGQSGLGRRDALGLHRGARAGTLCRHRALPRAHAERGRGSLDAHRRRTGQSDWADPQETLSADQRQSGRVRDGAAARQLLRPRHLQRAVRRVRRPRRDGRRAALQEAGPHAAHPRLLLRQVHRQGAPRRPGGVHHVHGDDGQAVAPRPGVPGAARRARGRDPTPQHGVQGDGGDRGHDGPGGPPEARRADHARPGPAAAVDGVLAPRGRGLERADEPLLRRAPRDVAGDADRGRDVRPRRRAAGPGRARHGCPRAPGRARPGHRRPAGEYRDAPRTPDDGSEEPQDR